MSCTANVYPFTFIKLHVHSHNYFPKNKHVHSNIYWSMQVHLHADLVYLFISITGIVATPIPIYSTTSLVNKLETPIYTHTHMLLRLANDGNINLATNIYIYIYRLMWSTGKRVAVSMASLVCFEIKLLDPH